MWSCFVLPLFYWLFLILVTAPVVINDAVGYFAAGQQIAAQGWMAFLRGGPQREPLFLFLISLAVQWGAVLHAEPLFLLKLINFSLLFFSRALLWQILSRLKIAVPVIAAALLYTGISPAILDSALGVWSEIAAFPFVLLAGYAAAELYLQATSGASRRAAFGWAVVFGVGLLGAVGVKGIFEWVAPVFLFFYALCLLRAVGKQRTPAVLPALALILTVGAAFYAPLTVYKALNQAAHGQFVLTNRASTMFWGMSQVKTQDYTQRQVMVEALQSLNLNFPQLYERLFSAPEREFWYDPRWAPLYGGPEDLKNVTNPQVRNREITRRSLRIIAGHPGRFLWMCLIDSVKMFFWENSRVQNSAYPAELTAVYWSALNSWLFLPNLLTLISFGFVLFYVGRAARAAPNFYDALLVFTLALQMIFVGFYSMFWTIHRFAAPLIFVYIIWICVLLNRLFFYRPKFANPYSAKKGWGLAVVYVLFIAGGLWLSRLMLAQAGSPRQFPGAALIGQLNGQKQKSQDTVKLITLSNYTPAMDQMAKVIGNEEKQNQQLTLEYRNLRRAYYEKAVEFFPQMEDFQALYGFCLYYDQRRQEAKQAYTASLVLNPYLFWSYYDLAVIAFEEQDYGTVVGLLSRAMQINPEITVKVINLSSIYRQIWRHLSNPGEIIAGDIESAQKDAVRMLMLALWHLGQYEQIVKLSAAAGQKGWQGEVFDLYKGKSALQIQKIRPVEKKFTVKFF
ncbi:MAG: hypothetical protein HQL23_09165 [Candidatus Omnitrophica bacterium]|nr:hypothetical protein [Candidatus Omnitrophota bacterium]